MADPIDPLESAMQKIHGEPERIDDGHVADDYVRAPSYAPSSTTRATDQAAHVQLPADERDPTLDPSAQRVAHSSESGASREQRTGGRPGLRPLATVARRPVSGRAPFGPSVDQAQANRRRIVDGTLEQIGKIATVAGPQSDADVHFDGRIRKRHPFRSQTPATAPTQAFTAPTGVVVAPEATDLEVAQNDAPPPPASAKTDLPPPNSREVTSPGPGSSEVRGDEFQESQFYQHYVAGVEQSEKGEASWNPDRLPPDAEDTQTDIKRS